MWHWPLPGLLKPPAGRPVATVEPTPASPLPAGAVARLLPVLVVAIVFRALPDLWSEHPAGLDWGLYVAWADQFLAEGRLPSVLPHYQSGLTRWLFFPGGPLALALPASLAGVEPVSTLPVLALVGAVEAAGVFLLAWRLFGRLDAALAAALAAAVHPGSVEIAAWGGFGNLLGLGLLPFAWVAGIELWQRGGVRPALVFAAATSAVAVSHSLTAFWLFATLALALLPVALRHPRPVVGRLRVALPVAAVLCGPVLLHAADVGQRVGGLGFFFGADDRFAETGGFVAEALLSPAGAISVALLLPGLAVLVLRRATPAAGRALVMAHLALAVAFTFGGPLGLHFHHWRAAFYFGLLSQLALGALLLAFDRGRVRTVLAVALLAGLAGPALDTAARSGAAYRVASPALDEAAAWLRAHSAPDDVVLTSNWLGFHLLRAVPRPTLVAVPERDFFNASPAAVALARDARRMLAGEADAAKLLAARRVDWVVVRRSGADVPDPAQSRAWLRREPAVEPAWANADVAIYRVRP